jgi:cyclic pyranopterin phosphate synthase
MPADGLPWLRRDDRLTYPEITRLVALLAPRGVRSVRLTGGEPLLRPGLADLVRTLKAIPDLAEVAITTNGTRLEHQAAALVTAGVDRFNISLDSLDPARFSSLTRRDALPRVRRGLHELAQVAPGPIKINVVALADITEHEVFGFVELARDTGCEVRFIEFMPLDADRAWTNSRFVPGQVLLDMARRRYDLVAEARRPAATARTFSIRGSRGRIGLIEPISKPFCSGCDRIRLTADGKLRTCLFSLTETDLRTPLRDGTSDEDLLVLLRAAVWRKELKHRINEPGFVQPARSMSAIGG